MTAMDYTLSQVVGFSDLEFHSAVPSTACEDHLNGPAGSLATIPD
jgi:hypothetical protein